jgi:hypothetical protein
MANMEIIEKRLAEIEARNTRVELDKAWETSIARKLIIAVVTYLLISLYLIFLGIAKPWLNAVVPTIGFLLSTLTISWAKSIWMKQRKK